MSIATLQNADRYAGPLMLKQGFRLLWLCAIIWVLSMLIWLPVLAGGVSPPSRFLPADWRIYLIQLALLVSIVARAAAGYGPAYTVLIHTSAVAWCVAHGTFVVRYWRLYTSAA